MSKNSRRQPEVVHEINAVSREVKREKHVEVQRDKGDSVVKWIFLALIGLALASLVYFSIYNA